MNRHNFKIMEARCKAVKSELKSVFDILDSGSEAEIQSIKKASESGEWVSQYDTALETLRSDKGELLVALENHPDEYCQALYERYVDVEAYTVLLKDRIDAIGVGGGDE